MTTMTTNTMLPCSNCDKPVLLWHMHPDSLEFVPAEYDALRQQVRHYPDAAGWCGKDRRGWVETAD